MSARVALVLAALLAGRAAAQGPVITSGAGAGSSGGVGAPTGASAVTALAPLASTEPDAPLALAGRADGVVMWLRLDGDQVGTEDAGELPGAVVAVAVAQDGAGWALDDGGALARVTRGVPEASIVARHAGGAMGLALSPDGTLAATSGSDGTLRVWSTSDGAEVAALEGHEGAVGAVVWGETGPWSVGWDGTLRGWTARGRRFEARPRTIPIGSRELCAVALASDGTLVVAGYEGALLLVDASKKKVSALPERGNPELVRALAASPDGARLLAVLPGECGVVLVELRDPTAPLRWIVTVADGKPPSSACFTRDGQHALVGRYDGSVRRAALPAPAGGGR